MGVVDIGVTFLLRCQHTAEWKLGQEAQASRGRAGKRGALSLGGVGVGEAAPSLLKGSSLRSLWFPGAPAAALGCQLSTFPQPEAPPSLSESNDFLKMDSLLTPPPAAINLLNTKWPLEEAPSEFRPVQAL